jgi:GDP-mannose 6-dehydrogenase
MKISVFGLGHVGAVSASCLGSLGHTVIGTDVDPRKVRLVGEGCSPVEEPGLEAVLSEAVAAGRLTTTEDPHDAVRASEFSLVCVGTPGDHDSLDLTNLESACRALGRALRKKADRHIVVVRSTVLPGTIRGCLVPLLESASGKRAGEGFAVAAVPEFLRQGSALDDFFHPPLIVIGSNDPATSSRVALLFEGIDGPLSTSSIEAAEMVKVASNAWHGVKVAFANEIGTLCDVLAIDAQEVMQVFVTDAKLNLSKHYLKPGFAFGGQCLIKDIRAVSERARSFGLDLPLIHSVLPSNDRRLERGVGLVVGCGRKTVSLLGLSYKPETDDFRDSPFVELCCRLIARGLDLRVFDPRLSASLPRSGRSDPLRNVLPEACPLLVDSLGAALTHGDVIVIGTPRTDFTELRLRLRPGQFLVDLARGSVDVGPGTG